MGGLTRKESSLSGNLDHSHTSAKDPWRYSGVALTAAIGLVLLALRHWVYPVPSPGLVLMLGILYAAWRGGLWPAVVSALVAVAMSAALLADETWPLTFQPLNQLRFLSFAILLPLEGIAFGIMAQRLKRAQERPLREREEQLNAILSGMHDAILETDFRGIRIVNDSFCRMTGFSRDELLAAKPPYPFWPEEGYAAIAAALETSMRGKALDFELVLTRKDGERFPVLLSVSRLPDDLGRARTLYSFKDISDIKAAEESLRRSESHLRLALQGAQLGTWELRFPHRVVSSRNLAPLFGLPEDASPDFEQLRRMMDPADRDAMDVVIGQAIKQGGRFQVEYRVTWPDASEHYLLGMGQVLKNAAGEAEVIYGITMDITRRKKAEIQLDAARRQVEGILASISDGFMTLARDETCLYVNVQGARMLGKTPEDILGRRLWDVFPASRQGAFRRSCLQSMAENRVVVLEEYYSESVGAWFTGTIYPYDGGVSVFFQDITARRAAAAELEAARQARQRLLDVLAYRLRTPLAPMLAAAGELAAASDLPTRLRHDVDMIRRNIDAQARIIDSVLDQKPANAPAATEPVDTPTAPDASAPAKVEPVAPGLTILLVEDHPDTRDIMARVLRRAGYDVKTARTVAEALQIVTIEDVGLLVSDIGLPDGTGHELLAKVRKIREVPAIAISGYGTQDDIDKSLNSGFAAHLTKPVMLPALQEAIGKALTQN